MKKVTLKQELHYYWIGAIIYALCFSYASYCKDALAVWAFAILIYKKLSCIMAVNLEMKQRKK